MHVVGAVTSRRLVTTLLVAGLTGVAAAPAVADTTLDRTIVDRGDNRLAYGPGEGQTVRDELGTASAGREHTRRSLMFLAHLTDSQLVDEESPARVEFLDRIGPPFTSAYRPMEGLTPHSLDRTVDALRAARSPATGRRLEAVMTTGDNTDNTQLNETRWFIDLMNGGVEVDPDSGIPGTCGTDPHRQRLYDGVRGEDQYYEPDASGPEGANRVDGPGYSPHRSDNRARAGRSNVMRDFPGLFEDMNRPFRARGLGGIPWYAVFGNHDALMQGTQGRNPAYAAVATGCVKVKGLSPDAAARLREMLPGAETAEDQQEISRLILEDVLRTAADPEASGAPFAIVPSDPARVPLRKREWIEEHLRSSGTPTGHGFTHVNAVSEMGNYSFSPKPGLRFIALDSVAETGNAGGNIDHDQFVWLHQELLQAEGAGELAVVFAHHSLRTMNQPPLSPFPGVDAGGNLSPLVHYGNGPGTLTQPCTVSDRLTPPPLNETLRCLMLRHHSVVSFVVGHEHVNRVVANRPGAGDAPALRGRFWEIASVSTVDWPQQARLLELFDNRDGNLSIVATIVDQTSDPDPGGGATEGESSPDPDHLASIARELSYNDPHARNGRDGSTDHRGRAQDRNVELVIRHPYDG